jgi:hypothetical protein
MRMEPYIAHRLEAGPEDAFYFLEERPPLGSIYHADGGYTTLEGICITRELREEFYTLRKRYRDRHRHENEPIPLISRKGT